MKVIINQSEHSLYGVRPIRVEDSVPLQTGPGRLRVSQAVLLRPPDSPGCRAGPVYTVSSSAQHLNLQLSQTSDQPGGRKVRDSHADCCLEVCCYGPDIGASIGSKVQPMRAQDLDHLDNLNQ